MKYVVKPNLLDASFLPLAYNKYSDNSYFGTIVVSYGIPREITIENKHLFDTYTTKNIKHTVKEKKYSKMALSPYRKSCHLSVYWASDTLC